LTRYVTPTIALQSHSIVCQAILAFGILPKFSPYTLIMLNIMLIPWV